MNQLNVNPQHSIATLTAKGWSARKVARALGLHRDTVGRYLGLTMPEPAASTSRGWRRACRGDHSGTGCG